MQPTATPWRRSLPMRTVRELRLQLERWSIAEAHLDVEIRATVARLSLRGIHTALQLEINGRPCPVRGAYLPVLGRGDLEISPFVRYGTNRLVIRAAGFPLSGELLIRIDEPVLRATFLHLNDPHSQIDALPRMAAAVRTIRQSADRPLFLINAGDSFAGAPVSDLNHGVPMIQALNAMGLDLMTVGNHDFDYGPAQTVARRVESRFPWLSANTRVEDPALTPIREFAPYLILTTDLGQRIGFFGLVQTPPTTVVENIAGLAFDDPVETARNMVAELRPQVNLVVAVSHIGLFEDRNLARQVAGIDLIVGGHTHSVLPQPLVENGVPIVQAGANGLYLGRLDLEAGAGGLQVSGRLLPVESMTEVDPEVEALVDRWNAEMAPILDQPIGELATDLDREGRHLRDVAPGNMVTDAMRERMSAQIAFTNNSGIRASLAAGPVSLRNLGEMLPFGNYFLNVVMTGEQIKEAVIASYNRRNQIDLQTSGLYYVIVTGQEGHAVDADLLWDGRPLEMEATYTVTLTNYLIGTGTHLFASYGLTPVKISYKTDLLEVAEFIRRRGTLAYPPTEGRIAVRPR